MFHVSVRAMESAAEELQRQLRKLNQAMEAAQDVKNRLNGLSGMEDVRRKLGSEISNMERERRKLFSLLAALRQAARCYADCERNVMDYAEGGRRRGTALGWYEVGMGSEVLDLAKQIIF